MKEPGLIDIDLSGLRIGLSGAVPDQAEWGERSLDWEILNFISIFADAVFRYGGMLVHGCHPSFTPRILGLAEPYEGKRDLTLVSFVMSDLWQDGYLAEQLRQQRYTDLIELVFVERVVMLEATDIKGDHLIRNASLTAMRERLVELMDIMVVIVGKSWTDTPMRPGTLEELEFALERNIPVFLLGGFGGMAEQLAKRKDFCERLGHGLDNEVGNYLLTTANASKASALIINRCDKLRQERLSTVHRYLQTFSAEVTTRSQSLLALMF